MANLGHRRRSSSVAPLPVPPSPQHTNLPVPRHHRDSQISLSSSAPSVGSLLMAGVNLDARRLSQPNISLSQLTTTLTIEFDGGTHVIVRPNRVIRGKVVLDAVEPMNVSRIKIKFRAEETATVKVEEGGGEGKGEWIHQVITTFFTTEFRLFGAENCAYSQCAWEELGPGHYEFPFALKFPNINYPPSMEEPPGFGIRYIWTAQAEGPALQSGLKSREYITPYRPIIISTTDKEWNYKTTLVRDKKQALAEVRCKVNKQSYCPDEPFSMQLNIAMLHSDAKISGISFQFRKHHEGKMLVQQGTAFREYVRNVIQGTVPITTGESGTISEPVQFDIPTRLVSPSFASRHTRIHYDVHFNITIELGHLFKTTHIAQFAIPVSIANLPHDQLLRITELTSVRSYRDSLECPIFFDSNLDEPPTPQGLPNEILGSLSAALRTPPNAEEPPSYFSLPSLPPQFEGRKERTERTVYLTRSAKGAFHAAELGDTVIIPGLFDEDW